jgi:hypothetical protein
MQDNDLNDQSIITPSLSVIEQQERASIDMLISTAKKFPRDLTRVKRSMEAMATLDAETAEGCNYTLKRKDKSGAEVLIQGPSVRMAEIAVASYGNIRAGSRVIANDGKSITGQAFCHDLENNTFIAWETQRRITDRNGRTYGEDLQVLTGNAASAIAFRNAVFKVIPSAFIKPVADKALQVAVGDIKTLEERRQRALKKFATLGVDTARILSFLAKTSVDQIDIVDVENLFGIFTAIKEGTTSIEEQFPREPKVVEPNFSRPPEKTEVAEPLKRGPGRPRKVEGFTPEQIAEGKRTGQITEDFMPTTAAPTAPIVAPPAPLEPKPSAPPQPPPKGPQAPPAAPDSLYWKLHKRLAEEGINHDRFLVVMYDFGFLEGVEREDISNGSITLSQLADKAIGAALADWKTVTENLPPV